ncbi:MAG: MFS transporter [Candidatus Thorarchaeota archaeon]
MSNDDQSKESQDATGSVTAVVFVPQIGHIDTVEAKEIDKEQLDFKGNKKSLLWFISIFSSTGQFFFDNFFSAFVAKVGVTGRVMGFITSIRNLLNSIFQGYIGLLSDRIGRKLIMFIGIALNFLITIPLLFFENTWLLIFVAIVQAFSLSVFIPAWNAVLGDVTQPEIRATFIGKIASIGRLISVSFSLIIAVIFYLADEVFYGTEILGWTVIIPWRIQYSVAFGIAALNSLIAILLIATLKETKAENITITKPRLSIAFKDKSFIKFVIFYALFGFSMSFVWPLNPIIQVNVLNMEFYQIAIISSAFIIVMSVVQVISGKLGDKYGRKPIFIAGALVLVLYPVSLIPAIVTNNWIWLIVANGFAGIGTGSFFVSLNALTLDLAPNELMGSYSGLREMFFGGASFVGSLIAGFIVDALEFSYGLYIATIVMCIGISILRFLASIGFLFVAESLPKNIRESRKHHLNNNKKILLK